MKQIHILLPLIYFFVYFGGRPLLLLFLIIALFSSLFHRMVFTLSLLSFALLGIVAHLRDATVHFTHFNFEYALRDELAHYILEQTGNPILLSLATGYRFFDASFKESLAMSGSYHLIAISAMHIGVVIGVMLFFARLTTLLFEKPSLQWGISRLFAYGGSGWYLIITGGSLPTIRAYFFFVFADLLFSCGIAAHSLFLLLLSLVITSLVVPGSLGTISFFLSALSVGGVVLLWRRLPQSYSVKLIVISLLLQLLLAPILADMNGYIVLYAPLVALLTIPLLALSVPLIFALQISMFFPFEWLHSLFFLLANFVTELLSVTIVESSLFSRYLLLPVASFSLWMKVVVSVGFFWILIVRNRWLKGFLIVVVGLLFFFSSTALLRLKTPQMVWRKEMRILCISHNRFSGRLVVLAGGYGGWVYRAKLTMKELSVVSAKCGFVQIDRVVISRGVSFSESDELKKRLRFSHCRISDISHDFSGVADRFAVIHEDNPATALLSE
ncbi:ComEC/Rec2 family competence protein [bacterium]|nr:ComEC/Rec2 family competence protein [bacterium]